MMIEMVEFYADAVGDGRITSVRRYLSEICRSRTVYDGSTHTREDPYYRKEVAKARRTLRAARSMSLAEAEKVAETKYVRDTREYKKEIVEDRKRAKRYKTMLEKLKRWEPPSRPHKDIKNGALNELKKALRDVLGRIDEPPQRLTGEQYKHLLIEQSEQRLENRIKEYEEHLEGVKSRRDFISGFRRGLPKE